MRIENKPILPVSQDIESKVSAQIKKGPNDLLSRKDIEAETNGGITCRWLELAAHRGHGPPMLKISRRMVRYRRRDFEAWLDAHVVHRSA